MTPDNGIYYHLAYTFTAIIYVGYAVTLVLRRRNLVKRANALRTGSDRA